MTLHLAFWAAVLVGFDEEVHLSCFSGFYILQKKYLFYLFEVDRSKIVDAALKLVAQQFPLSSDVEPLLAFLMMARGVSCGILI